ncbi:50S ribosomal protein L18 [Candidatus Woesearchaeota archaeon]|nr:50S ribosomal protein L18 [Candidatus Woesearchaeota archaeon]
MKSTIAVQFARKLSGRTSYRKRLALLKSGIPRLVVRKTLTSIIFQVVEFALAGDIVKLTLTSKVLRRIGWTNGCKNIPAAYLSGLLFGKLALAANINHAVADVGIQTISKGGKIFAAIKGVKDAGVDVPLSDDVVPAKDAISGAHIANFAKVAKQAAVANHAQFARVGLDVALRIPGEFEKVKSAIVAGKWKTPKEVRLGEGGLHGNS